MSISTTNTLKAKPKSPSPSECCGNGCRNCVWDVYEEELKIWELENLKSDDNSLNEQQVYQMNSHAYIKFKLVDIIKQTSDTNIYKFSFAGDSKLFSGKHLIIRTADSGSTICRQYTPIVWNKTDFKLLIKLYENGPMSEIIRKWSVGQEVECRGPCGGIEYSANTKKFLWMLAAGTGITPMIQMIQFVLSNEDDFTRIKLLFAIPTFQSILLKDILKKFQSFWNVSIIFCLSQEKDEAIERYEEQIYHGKISQELLKSELKTMGPKEEILPLICGPWSFNEDMIVNLGNLGFLKEDCIVF